MTAPPLRRVPRAAASRSGVAALFVFAGLVGILGLAGAQRQTVPREQDRHSSRIGRLEITVEDLQTGRALDPIAPEGMLFLRVGQSVRLHMTALPAVGGPPRHPSTRFTPNESRHLRIDEVNPDAGSILVTGVRPHGATGAMPIVYEVLEPWAMHEDLRSARVYVKVVADTARQRPSAAPIDRGSVTFYQDDDFRGRRQQFFGDEHDLDDNPIGNDTISSLRVSPGCRVYLYEHDQFRGLESEITGDVRTLRGSRVGNDAVSSFRLDCAAWGGRGVTLFADDGFRGPQEKIVADDADLEDNTAIGNDRASSVRVDTGCEAWLFEHAGFRGASVYLTGDMPALERTVLGNDSASSVRVRCR